MEALNQAKLAVMKSQNDLDNAVIHAPFSGIITSVTANPGDQLGASTAVAQIVDPSRVELDAQVDEATFAQIKVGMPVIIRGDALGQLNGVITTIVPSGVTTQGVVLFPVVITITSPNATLPNQASASQIQIIIQAQQNALAVPGNYVYRDAANNQVVDRVVAGKRIPTKIVTGLSATAGTEVTSGLAAGDQIAKPVVKKKAATAAAVGQGGVPGLPAGAPGR